MPNVEIAVRQAALGDEISMDGIYHERLPDMEPGDWRPSVTKEKQLEAIQNSLAEPEQFLVRVATVASEVAGYCMAEALSDDQYTWWRGLLVARSYESQGVGQALEAERREWARSIGRPVCVRIVVGNDRSMNFFDRQGFDLDPDRAHAQGHLRFHVMELAPVALRDDPMQNMQA